MIRGTLPNQHVPPRCECRRETPQSAVSHTKLFTNMSSKKQCPSVENKSDNKRRDNERADEDEYEYVYKLVSKTPVITKGNSTNRNKTKVSKTSNLIKDVAKKTKTMFDGMLTPPPSQIASNNDATTETATEPLTERAADTRDSKTSESTAADSAESLNERSAADSKTRDAEPGLDTAESGPHPDVTVTQRKYQTDRCEICESEITPSITITCNECRKKICFTCTGFVEAHFILLKCTKRRFSCMSCTVELINKLPTCMDIQRELRASQKASQATEKQPPAMRAMQTAEKGTQIPETPVESNQNTPKADFGTQTPIEPSTPPSNEDKIPLLNLSESLADTPPPKKSPPKKEKDRKDKICKYYKNGGCKSQNDGTHCPYRHPRACRYELKYGPKGCKWGSNCKFLHPRFCRDSLRSHTCLNLDCGFYHLKGTKRYPQSNENQLPSGSPPKNGAERIPQEKRMDFLERNIREIQENMTTLMGTFRNYQENFPPLPSMMQNPQIPQIPQIPHMQLAPHAPAPPAHIPQQMPHILHHHRIPIIPQGH